MYKVDVTARTEPKEFKVVVSNGPRGEPFTYDDFTPEQIEELQRPAKNATDAANDAADLASNAAVLANEKAGLADAAAIAANAAAGSANNAAVAAGSAANAANSAADNANAQRGWTPVHVEVTINSNRIVKRLIEYIGGVGDPPTENIGLYVGEGEYVEDPQDALNYKGRPGVDAPIVFGTTANTVAEGNDERINNGQRAYEYLVSQNLI